MRARRISIIVLLVTLFILLLTFTVAYADSTTRTLTIDNESSDDIKVTLYITAPNDVVYPNGVISYTFWVEKGDTDSYDVKRNTYWIEYNECSLADDPTNENVIDYYVNLDKRNVSITIHDCKHQPVRLWVSNHMSEEPTLGLYGPDDYEFDIDKGRNSVRLYSGLYVYVYEACDGQTFTGEIYVTKNGLTNLILHSCEWFLHPAQVYGGPNPVGFKIVNHASFPVIMTLIGPETYLETIEYGVNKLELVRGSYRFSYYQNLSLVTGNFVVTPNGMGVLVITPWYTIDYVVDEDLE